MGHAASQMSKQQTRKLMREQRRNLTPRQQTQASDDLARTLSRQLFFVRARHIAFYLPNDGEIDPTPLLELAVAAGKRAFLPVLDRRQIGQLSFVNWQPGQPLIANRFGIPEPIPGGSKRCRLWTLDLVLMPLVAFDGQGNRLGMGGGFYDRTFARNKHRWSRPLLIGLAHHFQQLEALAADPWDIPLHAIATDKTIIFPHPIATEATP